MSASSQGASSLGGHAALHPGLVQPVSRDHAAPKSASSHPSIIQISQERSMSNQIQKLTVRPLIDSSNLEINGTRHNASTPSTHS